jgi:adenylosuccinate synthase
MQWGDEGKGKIVDLICPAFDLVARFQGGHNAGHTVKFGDRHFALRLIPSGIVHPGMQCVLGNGMVLAPDAFFDELRELTAAGVDAGGRLWISERAQLLLPAHAELDQAREAAKDRRRIGTTARGIGPAYESKAARFGLRAVDLFASDLEPRLADLLSQVERGHAVGAERVASLVERCRQWGEQLAPFLCDTARLLNRAVERGDCVLFEGAQGALLDVDHGTYPFVTSSSTTAGGAATGTGVPPTALSGAIGVLKAYTTRVGGGPFPAELEDETGERLRRRGNEFGTVTGRPRRCGWFDAVAASYACMLNGIDAVALTKLDILDDLEEIPVCVGYSIGGKVTRDFPAGLDALAAAEPVYETLPGWNRPTTGLLDYAELPPAAHAYVRFLESQVGAPVVMISTGPRREETILRTDSAVLDRLTSGRLASVLAERGA